MDGFIAQIIMFAGNFAPRNWAFCEGQLLPISQNTALFSLIGTIYGGDGRTTFALPDLRGRVPISPGTGPGLSTRQLGQRSGTETNTLLLNNLPSHNHSFVLPAKEEGDADAPSGKFIAGDGTMSFGNTSDSAMAPLNTANTGSNTQVNNMQPYLCVNYIICLYGTFPSRS